MATAINIGGQQLSFDYKHPAKGLSFNTVLKDLIAPGVYAKGGLSHSGNNVSLQAETVFYIHGSSEVGVRVKTGAIATVDATGLGTDVSPAYLVATFNWTLVAGNTPDWYAAFSFISTNTALALNQVCFGKIYFSAIGNVIAVSNEGQTRGTTKPNLFSEFQHVAGIISDPNFVSVDSWARDALDGIPGRITFDETGGVNGKRAVKVDGGVVAGTSYFLLQQDYSPKKIFVKAEDQILIQVVGKRSSANVNAEIVCRAYDKDDVLLTEYVYSPAWTASYATYEDIINVATANVTYVHVGIKGTSTANIGETAYISTLQGKAIPRRIANTAYGQELTLTNQITAADTQKVLRQDEIDLINYNRLAGIPLDPHFDYGNPNLTGFGNSTPAWLLTASGTATATYGAFGLGGKPGIRLATNNANDIASAYPFQRNRNSTLLNTDIPASNPATFFKASQGDCYRVSFFGRRDSTVPTDQDFISVRVQTYDSAGVALDNFAIGIGTALSSTVFRKFNMKVSFPDPNTHYARIGLDVRNQAGLLLDVSDFKVTPDNGVNQGQIRSIESSDTFFYAGQSQGKGILWINDFQLIQPGTTPTVYELDYSQYFGEQQIAAIVVEVLDNFLLTGNDECIAYFYNPDDTVSIRVGVQYSDEPGNEILNIFTSAVVPIYDYSSVSGKARIRTVRIGGGAVQIRVKAFIFG